VATPTRWTRNRRGRRGRTHRAGPGCCSGYFASLRLPPGRLSRNPDPIGAVGSLMRSQLLIEKMPG
jgi:hypothetical protein